MRRSKEDSLKTRELIVHTARAEFARRGVSQTTMEHIASAAGLTRGAIYGHFKDKSDLFSCMREQLHLPMIDRIVAEITPQHDDPLAGVATYLKGVVGAMAGCGETSEALLIMNFKCEYVNDLERDMQRQVSRCRELTETLEKAYRRAARNQQLREGISPSLAALDTCAFLLGVVRLWLLDGQGDLIKARVGKLIDAHIDGLRSTPVATAKARKTA